ncbi:hypothetical protein THASP1DRAFT_31789 [Thamnocephalis sphaerospora]|uniref:SnoaL-like domain-containing protein n=1 Tax=Thamnocephalis sphaerospora TaxID=78915 RepID=A0A4V1IW56_9FUNG|nr:hypothetical protein THASP1DRAFT_31789 [Thamnocephalis sphaerospora]|eukprot:RKP06389.1 hypothetical protein THASP1DRAFT_31789 [Thamnocephalis sphaerospora]
MANAHTPPAHQAFMLENAAELSPERHDIVQKILANYMGRVLPENFAYYDVDATFEDSLGLALGVRAIESQFIALARLVRGMELLHCSVARDAPDCLELNVSIRYQLMFNQEKTLPFLMVLRFGENDKIIAHEDRWHHQPLYRATDGFIGRCAEIMRYTSGKVMELCFPPPTH